MQTIEFFGSIDCPYAYLAVYRLRKTLPEFAGRVQVTWRALSLEYINRSPVSRPVFDTEGMILGVVEPELPMRPWPRAGWDWPVSMWPAFEALACAQAQGPEAALAMNWALRFAFYGEGRNICLRHELLAVAGQVAAEAPLDLPRFEADWDSGRYKQTVIDDSRRGWHVLKVEGSPTLLLPGGRQVTNPGVGALDYDEVANIFHGYTPPTREPLMVYRELLEQAARE